MRKNGEKGYNALLFVFVFMNLESFPSLKKTAAAGILIAAAACSGAKSKGAAVPARSCPLPSASASASAEPPVCKPEQPDQDYLLTPINASQFREAIIDCAATFEGSRLTGELLQQMPDKTCRTWQLLYDNKKKAIDVCMPVVRAEGFSYAKSDPDIMMVIVNLKHQLRKMTDELAEAKSEFSHCFPHNEKTEDPPKSKPNPQLIPQPKTIPMGPSPIRILEAKQ